MRNSLSYREILRNHFEERRQRNQLYSLRAFSRDIGLSPSRLSEILNEKAGLSPKSAQLISQRLTMSPREAQHFFDLVESCHAKSNIKKNLAKIRLTRFESSPYELLRDDQFQVISKWYHFAILELFKLREFKSSVSWISKSLGITLSEAETALARLSRLELIENKAGKLHLKSDFVATTDGIPSQAIRSYHRVIIEKAKQSLEQDSVEARDFSSMTMAIDRRDILLFREMVKKFRREVDQRLHRSRNKNSVYQLAIQFFEVSKMEGDS